LSGRRHDILSGHHTCGTCPPLFRASASSSSLCLWRPKILRARSVHATISGQNPNPMVASLAAAHELQTSDLDDMVFLHDLHQGIMDGRIAAATGGAVCCRRGATPLPRPRRRAARQHLLISPPPARNSSCIRRAVVADAVYQEEEDSS
jgi:hypothetical protein